MLLGKITKVACVILSLVCFSVAYYSKPDRGGVNRCQEIFGLDLLNGMGFESSPFYLWKPFEDPKFRMRSSNVDMKDFNLYLKLNGFSDWKEGGLHYGSLNIGWSSSENVKYSNKMVSGHVHIIAHDIKHNVVYAILAEE